MGLLLREIADTTRLITDDDYLLKSLDGLDLLRPKWSREFNYEYSYDVNQLTSTQRQKRLENNNNNKKTKSESLIIKFIKYTTK